MTDSDPTKQARALQVFSKAQEILAHSMQFDFNTDWKAFQHRYEFSSQTTVLVARDDFWQGMFDPATTDQERFEQTVRLVQGSLIAGHQFFGKSVMRVFLDASPLYTVVSMISFFDTFEAETPDTLEALNQIPIHRYMAEDAATQSPEELVQTWRRMGIVNTIVALAGTAGAEAPNDMIKALTAKIPQDPTVTAWLERFDFQEPDTSWAAQDSLGLGDFCIPTTKQ